MHKKLSKVEGCFCSDDGVAIEQFSLRLSYLSSHQHPKVRIDQKEIIKEIDYQIQIRIIEARQLSGMQLDPVTTVTVGNQKKHTAVKEQTNTPFWDEV